VARVTVVTPAFNAAHLIPAAIQSVRAQTFEDWEMTVVDDGSTDGTADVVEAQVGATGGRLRCVRQPNHGPAAARNLAMQSTHSEFVALLDADDMYLPFHLDLAVQELRQNPGAALVHGRVLQLHPDGRIAYHTGWSSRLQGRIASALYTRRVNCIPSTVVFRRVCLDVVGYFDESLHTSEDRDLWLRMAERWEVRFIDLPVAIYRILPSSVSSDPDRAMRSQIAFVEKNFGRRGCGRSARRRAWAGIHRERGNQYFSAGQNVLARREYVRGLMAWPFEAHNAYMALRSFLRRQRPAGPHSVTGASPTGRQDPDEEAP
jgi:glycosyltransferase involved in cell wall biosynthesis